MIEDKNDISISINRKKYKETLDPWMLFPFYSILKAKSSKLAC